MQESTFILNGRSIALGATEPTESLLRWLRRAGLTGTKEGCGDGDCGACTVALIEADPSGKARYIAVNSCLLPMGSLPGREVLTVEALADGERLHPVQQAMVDTSGSQCGYCTPGFVMSLFVGSHTGELGDACIEGNLCRCTGYRPIREAARRLRESAATADRFTARLDAPPPRLEASALGDYHAPTSIDAALALRARLPDATWIAGGTDLGVALSRGTAPARPYVALDRIAELQCIENGVDEVRIGAAVPLTRIEHELAGHYRALDALWPWFAARQVRNRATLGGNLGTASPIGDLLPVLLALDATIELASPEARREVAAADFFTGYRRTVLKSCELIVAVRLPRRAGLIEDLIKIANRATDDISIVAAAFAIERDAEGRVTHARLAYGGVAATPVRAVDVEHRLLGRALDAATVDAAADALESAFTPLDDHRASAAYRRRLCGALFRRFVRERCA